MMETKSEYMMTEIGEIPANWEVCALGTYIKVQGGYAFKSKQFSDNGIRILRISNIKESGLSLNECKYYSDNDTKGLDNYYLNENDTVIAMSGATTGKSALVKKDNLPLLVNQRVGTYKRKNERNTDQKFIYYTVSSNYYQQKLWEHAIGGAQPNISSTQLESIIVAYPPLNEQQKIAEILSTVDEQIEQTDQLIEKTKELKKGLMQQLLTKGINHTKFKNSELGEIPVEWAIEKLKDLSDNMYQGINTVADKIKYEEEGVQILQAKHITKERFNYSDARFVSNQTFEKYKNKFNPIVNDILLSNIGTIGKTVRVSEHRDILIAWNIFLIRPKHEIDSIYLLYIFKRLAEIDYYDKFLTGNATKFINKTIIENILVPKPPLKEQQKIADILSSVDEDIEGYEEEKAKYEELKKGLMQQLLTGKTRVKVD